MPKFDVLAIESEEILEKLGLKYRYNFLNNNLQSVLFDNEFKFMRKVQKFCLRFEKKNNVTHAMDEDVYAWIPAFGAEGYVNRSHQYEMLDSIDYGDNWGMVAEMMRAFAVDLYDPQFNMGMGATVLAVNPLVEHHENVDIRLQALEEMVTGKSIGCILITEPERGSDATHMLTTAIDNGDGSYTLNGTKIFNTNAPKSKWAVAYATTEKNNWEKMGQFLIDTSWDGWNCERVGIPWVPKLWLGKEELKDLKIPKDYVIAGPGMGRVHLFEGLVPERLGIAVIACAQCWGALANAILYANMRRQFDQPVLLFQGVGFLLGELWSRCTNLTLALLCFAREYDRKFEKFEGKIPKGINEVMVASASQLKWQATTLSEHTCYQCANAMGGAGVCDNTLMHDLLGISRIQEVIGGTSQIQLYVISRAMRQLFKMSMV